METRSNKIFLLLLVFLNPFFINALVITEIMHDPEGSDTDREWIEIYNDGSVAIDLSTHKFFEANTNHGLTSHQGGNHLSAGSYAVIVDNPVKFIADNVGYSGLIFDSSFSLSNTGEFLAIKDAGGVTLDSLTYSSALGGENDGSTLSLISGNWTKGKATPGAANEFYSTGGISTQTSQNSSQTQTLPQAESQPNSDMAVIISEDKIVVAGADAEFKARAVDGKRKNLENVEYEWSFGDGGFRRGKSVTYHYAYPGIYIAAVEAKGENGIAFAKTKIRVISPELSIVKVGTENGKNFVEIRNNGKSEIDLTSWKLDVNGGYYPFPKNTYMLPQSEIRFTGEAMGFAYATLTPESKVRLLFPNLTEAVKYVSQSNMPKPIVAGVSQTVALPEKKVSIKVEEKKIETKNEVKKDVSTTTQPIEKRDRRLVLWLKSFFGSK